MTDVLDDTSSGNNSSGRKKIILIVFVFLAVIAIPLTVYIVQKQQEIRQQAQEGANLVCSPVGGMMKKLDSNTLIVTNNKTTPVPIWIQENICPFTGTMPAEGYQCNTYSKRYNDTVAPGQTKNYPIIVPDCKIGQIDINTINTAEGGCFTPQGAVWTGGLAFSISANSRNCNVTPTQAVMTATPTPITAVPTPTLTPIPTQFIAQITPTPTLPPSGIGNTALIGIGGLIFTIIGGLLLILL